MLHGMDGVDIVVMGRMSGRPELVVEVKLAGPIDSASNQLSSYMQRTGTPLGLVFVGNTLRILRDTFEEAGPGAVQVVGDFQIKNVEGLDPPSERGQDAGLEFESRVQQWIESLRDRGAVARLSDPLRAAVKEYLIPILDNGFVTAAGPRLRRAVAG